MTKHTERAIVAAQDYAQLVARGDVTLAEQAARTIDDLVGGFIASRRAGRRDFVWPTAVAQVAGVSRRRFTREVAQ